MMFNARARHRFPARASGIGPPARKSGASFPFPGGAL